MKNNKNNQKNKEKNNNKKKNNKKSESKEKIASNIQLNEEEDINTDKPKKQTKVKSKKSKKSTKNELNKQNKKKNIYLDEDNIIQDEVLLNPESLLTKTKITKAIDEEEKNESSTENKKDEFKIAKYFNFCYIYCC